MSEIKFREPTVKDASSILSLIKECKPLDENSLYLYVLLCHQFKKTCVVAEHDSKIVGFISTFVSPENQDTLFVWQAAVDKSFRNCGIAQTLITEALSQAGPFIRNVTATVTPSNSSSLQFLQNFANSLHAELSVNPLFSSALLGSNHEPEDLVTIGPIPQVKEISA